VDDGSVVVLHGPSGSGKTTLLRLIAGLEEPDAGEIHLGDALASRPGFRTPPDRRSLGMVFQTLALWPHMSVAQHLDFVLKGRIRVKVERASRVQAWLEALQLTGREQAYPHELSGGERQRVALARALCIEPGILLLDEPLTGLDRELRSEIRQQLTEIREQRGLTMVYVTHYPEEAEELADAVVRLANGRLLPAS